MDGRDAGRRIRRPVNRRMQRFEVVDVYLHMARAEVSGEALGDPADFLADEKREYWKGDAMADKTFRESFKASSEAVMEKVKSLIHEGNVRRVVIEHGGKTVAEFPLSVGVVGTVLAPVVAAIGALVAVLKDCTIHVERDDTKAAHDDQSKTA